MAKLENDGYPFGEVSQPVSIGEPAVDPFGQGDDDRFNPAVGPVQPAVPVVRRKGNVVPLLAVTAVAALGGGAVLASNIDLKAIVKDTLGIKTQPTADDPDCKRELVRQKRELRQYMRHRFIYEGYASVARYQPDELFVTLKEGAEEEKGTVDIISQPINLYCHDKDNKPTLVQYAGALGRNRIGYINAEDADFVVHDSVNNTIAPIGPEDVVPLQIRAYAVTRNGVTSFQDDLEPEWSYGRVSR